MGKGSKQRPTNQHKYHDGWERVFGPKNKTYEEYAENPISGQWLVTGKPPTWPEAMEIVKNGGQGALGTIGAFYNSDGMLCSASNFDLMMEEYQKGKWVEVTKHGDNCRKEMNVDTQEVRNIK